MNNSHPDQVLHHSESPEPIPPPVRATEVRRDFDIYPEYDWLEATAPQRPAYRPERLI